MSVQVQIWAPRLEPEPLAGGLREARLPVTVLDGLEQCRPDLPLLLAYTDPVGLLDGLALEPQASGAAGPFPLASSDTYIPLLAACERLEGTGIAWRLVNQACICSAAVVAWCVEPRRVHPPMEVTGSFTPPAALDALLASRWLDVAPGVLADYLRLEAHPRSAALDYRPVDAACLERLKQASSVGALAESRRRWRDLLAEQTHAAAQRQHLHRTQLDNQALREQVMNLERELEIQVELQVEPLNGQIRSLEARRADLELSLQLCHEELSQMGRRLALLEHLVQQGSQASRGIQGALAQVLGG